MQKSSLIEMMFDNVRLQADEYFPSYIYRLMQFANFMSASHFLSLLRISSSRQIGETLPRWAVMLATEHYGEDQFEGIIDHNLLGQYWRCFVAKEKFQHYVEQQQHKRATGRVLFSAEKTLLPFQTIKLCPLCCEESVQRYGVGIFKARHQAPTAFICQEHEHVLYQRPVSEFKGFEFSQAFFHQNAYYKPNITIFHRWLDFETNRLFTMTNTNYREEVLLHKRVFMESSFYSHRRCSTSVNLNRQWATALARYLAVLYPHAKNDAGQSSLNSAFKASQIMDVNTATHPLLYLLFKFFYLFEFKA